MTAPQAPWIGKKQGKLALDEAVFGESFHGPLVHEAARAELNARRRGTASTKTRAEIAMTGAKAWRQKGTGRARAGSRRRSAPAAAWPSAPSRAPTRSRSTARPGAAPSARRSPCTPSAARSPAWTPPPSTSPPPSRPPRRWPASARERSVLADGEETCAKSFRNIAGASVIHVEDVGVADVIGAARLVLSRPPTLGSWKRRPGELAPGDPGR